MERDSWSPLELLKCFCESDYVERNADKAVECLSLDIHWFGTSDEEDVHAPDEAESSSDNELPAQEAPARSLPAGAKPLDGGSVEDELDELLEEY